MRELRWQRRQMDSEGKARQAKRDAKRAKKRSWRYQLKRLFRIRYCCPAATKDLPQYDSEVSFISILVSWKGTVLPLVLSNGLFWFLTASHGFFCVIWNHDDFKSHFFQDFDYKLLGVPTSLLVFFIVFYCGQCYNRYFELYEHCVGIAGCTMVWASLVRLHLPANKVLQWNAMRYILAAAHVEYYDLTEGISHDEWECIITRRLLSPAESEEVAKHQGFKPFLLISWALLEVQNVVHRAHLFTSTASGTASRGSPSRFPPSPSPRGGLQPGWSPRNSGDDGSGPHSFNLFANFAWNDFQAVAYDLRQHCSKIYSTLHQPVPFAYFHLLNLMVIVNLLLLAYGMAGLGPTPVTVACFTIVCVVFIGLRDLAVSMANPFGEDEIDFKFETFLAASYTNAIAHLCDLHPPSGSELPTELANPLEEFNRTSSVKLASTKEVAEVRKQRSMNTKTTFRSMVSFENAEQMAAEWAAKKEAEEKAEAAAKRAEVRAKMQAATRVQAVMRGRSTRAISAFSSSPERSPERSPQQDTAPALVLSTSGQDADLSTDRAVVASSPIKPLASLARATSGPAASVWSKLTQESAAAVDRDKDGESTLTPDTSASHAAVFGVQTSGSGELDLLGVFPTLNEPGMEPRGESSPASVPAAATPAAKKKSGSVLNL